MQSFTCGVQMSLSLAILIACLFVLLFETDRRTCKVRLSPLYGLLGWSTWLAYNAWRGIADSIPAQAMTLAVAVALLAYWRHLGAWFRGRA